MEVYIYTHGECYTEQEFITEIDTFLTGTLLWTRVGTIADTSSDKDYVWSSTGESEDRSDVYIRLRGNGDYIYLYGYGLWASTSAYWQEVYSSSNTKIYTYGYSFRYWAFGNKDFICFVVTPTIYNYADPMVGYAGFIRSYYTPEKDPVPLLIKGSTSSSYTWVNTPQAYMHSTNASGVVAYTTYGVQTGILNYDSMVRRSSLLMWPIPLYNTTASYKEVRGEPYGVYQVNGKFVGSTGVITTASGVFITYKQGSYSNTDAFAFGPIASASGIVPFTDY
jgi:hypothetical protein